VYLSLRGVSKRFGPTVAVDAIDLDVQQSGFVCFLGPSGCGKTTLLRMIAGLERPDRGTLSFQGADLSGVPERLRNFGMVFQSYSLFPNLTVRENVAYGLRCRRWKEADIRNRVAEMLRLTGLEDQELKYSHQLSGGQQQRVALARALAPSPHVLLLDEPLSALDAKVRQSLRVEIRRLQRELGITTIMVTHDQEEALAMADEVVVMNRGRIAQRGTPGEIYDNPADPFVADFIGRMNFMRAKVVSDGVVRVAGIDLSTPVASASGSDITLAIRPEAVELVEPKPGANDILTGSIRWIEFLGSFCRVTIDLPEARQISAEISPGRARALNLHPQAAVGVRLPVHALRAFAA